MHFSDWTVKTFESFPLLVAIALIRVTRITKFLRVIAKKMEKLCLKKAPMWRESMFLRPVQKYS